jgi:hypothetical protein
MLCVLITIYLPVISAPIHSYNDQQSCVDLIYVSSMSLHRELVKNMYHSICVKVVCLILVSYVFVYVFMTTCPFSDREMYSSYTYYLTRNKTS